MVISNPIVTALPPHVVQMEESKVVRIRVVYHDEKHLTHEQQVECVKKFQEEQERLQDQGTSIDFDDEADDLDQKGPTSCDDYVTRIKIDYPETKSSLKPLDTIQGENSIAIFLTK